MLAATSNSDICLLIAIVLFAVAGVLSCVAPFKAPVMALLSFGLAVYALAFLITP